MPSFRLWKKTKAKGLLRVAKVEWTQDDMHLCSRFVGSSTFERVVNILHDCLIQAILSGKPQSYRKGYLDCIRDFESLGVPPPPIETDGGDSSTMWQEE